MNHSRLLVHVVLSTIHHKHLNVVVKTYCTLSVNDHRHFPSGQWDNVQSTVSKGQTAVSIVPSLCLSPTLSLYFVLEIYIYIYFFESREYIEENRVTARVTNQISIRLQNTFLREYRRRTPGGTFTRRFVRVIDAHDRSKLAMGSSSIKL